MLAEILRDAERKRGLVAVARQIGQRRVDRDEREILPVQVFAAGGRVVCAEPDWASFFVDDDDADCVLEVCREWRKSIRNPFIGRALPRLLKSAGLTNIKTSGFLLATYGLLDVDLVFDLQKTSEILSEKNCSDSFNNWYKKLALRDPQLPVFAGVTIVIAAGLKE